MVLPSTSIVDTMAPLFSTEISAPSLMTFLAGILTSGSLRILHNDVQPNEFLRWHSVKHLNNCSVRDSHSYVRRSNQIILFKRI